MPNPIHDLPGDIKLFVPFPDVAAATVTSYVGNVVIPYDGYITAMGVTANAAVTGDNSNTKNINIDTFSAGTASEVANLDLPTGVNLVAGTQKAITVSTKITVSAGQLLSIEFEKVGNGVAITSGGLELTLQGR